MSEIAPTVSVIVPCYNQGYYLNEAVESVLAQTYPHVEIIVINDGSTDEDTARLLKHYEQPSVAIIHTANQGPSAARNTGIQQSQGEYILPLDADDRIAPTYLEKAVHILNSEPDAGIVYCQAELFGDKSGPFDLPGYSFPEILLGNMIFNSSLYRRVDWEKAGGYNENMVWGWEDYDFWLSIIELGRDVIRIPEVLYFHRELPNSRSQQMTHSSWVKSYAQIFNNHPQLYSNHIDTLFQSLIGLREEVHQAHLQLSELAHLRAIISGMQSSKFWKFRNQWFRLKKRLGLKVEDDLIGL